MTPANTIFQNILVVNGIISFGADDSCSRSSCGYQVVGGFEKISEKSGGRLWKNECFKRVGGGGGFQKKLIFNLIDQDPPPPQGNK